MTRGSLTSTWRCLFRIFIYYRQSRIADVLSVYSNNSNQTVLYHPVEKQLWFSLLPTILDFLLYLQPVYFQLKLETDPSLGNSRLHFSRKKKCHKLQLHFLLKQRNNTDIVKLLLKYNVLKMLWKHLLSAQCKDKFY